MGPSLVGRSEELAFLTTAVRHVGSGTGTVVHVVGEAGIGKTSLLAVASGAFERNESVVRTAAADETDRHRPLALVRALLPELERYEDTDPVGRAIAALERLATEGPVALIADDIHWADDTSLGTLRAFARRALPLGVALITSARPHPSPHALRRYEEVVARFGRLITPNPLVPAQLVELVAARTGLRPGPDLSRLLAETAGNPFLAVELLNGLQDTGQLIVGEAHVELAPSASVPERLVERLAHRTLLAVPDGDLLLRAAAVLPGGFTAEELAVLLDQPLADVLAAVLVAVDAAVFVDAGSNLAFRHDLLRRAVLEATPPSIVRTLYRRAAEILTARGAAAERIATCVLAGCDSNDPADVERLLAVGMELRDHNPAAAADLLRAALDGIAPDDARSAPAALALGWAFADAGRLREVPELLSERFSRAPRPLPIAVHRLRGHALSLSGRVGEAAERFGDEDPVTLVASFDPTDIEALDAASEVALLHVLNARFDDAEAVLEWLDRAPERASSTGYAYACAARAWLFGLRGYLELGVEHAREGVAAVAGEGSGSAMRARPTLALAILLDALGEGNEAREVLQVSTSDPPAPSWNRPLLQFALVVSLFRRGEWDDALAEAEAGLLGADETDLGLGVGWPYAIGTSIACARGDQATARAWMARGRGFAETRMMGTEWLLYATALVHEADGESEVAAKLLELVASAVLDLGAVALLLNPGTDTVRLTLATGRETTAHRVANAFTDFATKTASPIVHALAAWSNGLVKEDASLIERAAISLQQLGRGPEAARAWHDAAVVDARAGDFEDARRLAREAFALYSALGAEQLHTRLRSELRAAGLNMRPRRHAPRAETGWESLTTSEGAVIELVGDGLTNSEIGERLFISRRTVESHLGRVYSKLDVATRAQLVATVVRLRSEAPTPG